MKPGYGRLPRAHWHRGASRLSTARDVMAGPKTGFAAMGTPDGLHRQQLTGTPCPSGGAGKLGLRAAAPPSASAAIG